MVTKWKQNIFFKRILMVFILVSVLVVCSQIYKWDIKPPATTTHYNVSNPAMTICIGYGHPNVTDVSSFCEKRLPNTLIIGVTKCGTNALLTFLSQHPQIVRNTAINEYFFFNVHYTKGLEWYRDRLPYSLPGQVVIDTSAGYFAKTEVPERIFNLNPRIKLILAVRNPVDRAVSEYTMHRKNHIERIKSMRGFKPEDPVPPFELIWRRYLRVMYDTSLENWLKYFRLEQIHVVDGDALRKQPLLELKQIERFLVIESYFQEKHFYFNKTRGMFCMSEPRFEQDNCLSAKKGLQHPKINETVLQMMRDIFRPHNQRFFALSRKQFDWNNDTAIEKHVT